MPTTYAAYANLTAPNMSTGMPATTSSAASSTPASQRNSISSEKSQEAKKSSRWHRFLDELKPIETPLPPVGIYTPLPAHPAKQQQQQKKEHSEDSKARKALKAYRKFQDIVGGPRVAMAY